MNESVAKRDLTVIRRASRYAGAGRAVHVVAHVGRDPYKIGQRAGGDVRVQLCVWNDKLHSRRVVANAGKVHEWVVLLAVQARVSAREAGRGHRLHIGFPGQVMCLKLVYQRLTAKQVRDAATDHVRASSTIIKDALEAAGDGREVVGQAWMRHTKVARRYAIAVRQLIQVRRVGCVTQNLTGLMVLHHDVKNMLYLERWRIWDWRRSWRE